MKRLLFTVFVFSVAGTLCAQTPFSLDSATVYLRTLSVEIGARPMGSPNERRAMEFALRKLKEFGLDESYLMPIDRAPSKLGHGVVNTRTGVVVGVLRGTSSRIIVIGGHIDSADPDYPGANDDGSGSAVVLELARVLSQRQNQSTLVFAFFGGEEQGLIGSRFFVEEFPHINDVALMLQVDMANGADWLIPFIDVDTHSAPTWLVKAAYEEFDALGYAGLSYLTHFFALNSAIPGGGVGSDHQPFLQREIPAIDFTSDANDPIHTPEDSFENFLLPGLKRSGDLVYKLVERFDAGVPEETTGRYFLYEIGGSPFFIPLWALQVFVAISILAAIAAWVVLRRRFADTHPSAQNESGAAPVRENDAKIPGLKLFLLMLIIQTFVWFSENIVGILKGVRFPWWSDVTGYLILGFLGGMLGIWVALQFVGRIRLSNNSSRYFLRAGVLLSVFILLLSLLSTKLAFYPASALVLLSLAMVVRQRFFKILLWFASAHFMFHLMFSEGFGLITHALAEAPRSAMGTVILHLFYIIFFSLWS
ncbi:MAG TPA: M28 family peptidase, partial [Bacteroidota bacterium]